MNNADKFKSVFGLYATEVRAMSEKEFIEWLFKEADGHTIEPKKAKWHKRNNVNFSPFDGSSEYEFTCGWCGGATDRMTNFCPNCGAKMDLIL